MPARIGIKAPIKIFNRSLDEAANSSGATNIMCTMYEKMANAPNAIPNLA